jgi:hypothetical protein
MSRAAGAAASAPSPPSSIITTTTHLGSTAGAKLAYQEQAEDRGAGDGPGATGVLRAGQGALRGQIARWPGPDTKVKISGGELLLRADLPELLGEAAQLGLAAGFVTSGSLIAKGWPTPSPTAASSP